MKFKALPLVLCKGCKHFALGEGYCKLHGWCTRGDWFCGDGEKGEDDGKAD